MEVTKELKHEHREIEHMIDMMEKMGVMLATGDSSAVPQLRKAIDFIRGFADRCHHEKEENILFPVLEAHGVPRQGGPIGVLLHEHVLGRGFISDIAKSLDRYETGDKDAAGEIAENIKGFADFLRAHIQKEDMVLFPMAEKALPESEKAELFEKMEELERTLPGKTHHEYLHDIKDIEAAIS